jgi:hypothetical protein
MRHPPPGPVSGFSVRERNKIMSTDPSLIRTGAGLCLNNGSKSEYRVANFISDRKRVPLVACAKRLAD